MMTPMNFKRPSTPIHLGVVSQQVQHGASAHVDDADLVAVDALHVGDTVVLGHQHALHSGRQLVQRVHVACVGLHVPDVDVSVAVAVRHHLPALLGHQQSGDDADWGLQQHQQTDDDATTPADR